MATMNAMFVTVEKNGLERAEDTADGEAGERTRTARWARLYLEE